MKELTPFEFTPKHQPDKDKPITVTLAPLDAEGKWNIERTFEGGSPSWRAIVKSAKYIVDWSGDGVGEFSREALQKRLVNPTTRWRMFFGEITGHLWMKSILSEDDEKKS